MPDADRQVSTANQAYSLECLQISIVSVSNVLNHLPLMTSKLKLLITFVVSYLHFSSV